MSKRFRNALLAAICLLVAAAIPAQTKSADVPGNHSKDRLRMVIILSRHGVRSPTWPQDRLNSYSAQPWPKWDVAPGELTSRGYELVKQLGSFDRMALSRAGLLAAQGCKDAAKVYVWADTNQRTLASGKALAEGFFPGCAPEVHSLAAGETDPLFHPTANGVEPAQADTAFAELEARVKQSPDAHREKLLAAMQQVLESCASSSPCPRPVTQLQFAPISVTRGKNDHIVDLSGALPQASSFAENFLLEYTDGMPMTQVGWGKVDELQLRRFLALHSDYFNLMHRTPALARLEASNLLFHIQRTLEQAITQKPVDDAFGAPDDKLVLIVGHDTNIAGLAALLGLHWTLDGRSDDTPPGTELAFELWQTNRGYAVRMTVAMQTLRQLREMPELTLANPPARTSLPLPECSTPANTCSWEDFEKMAARAIDKNDGTAAHHN